MGPSDDAAFGGEIIDNRAWSLERSRLFAGAGEGVLAAAARVFRFEGFPAGSVIRQQGSTDARLAIVKRGQVQLCRHIDRRFRLPLATLTAGDLFGEETLFDRPHATAARSLTDSIVLSAAPQHIRPVLERSVVVAENLASIVTERLAQLVVVLEGLADEELVLRVFGRLETLCAEYGVKVSAGILLDIDLHPDDIAALVRTTPAAATRALSFLAQTQAIRVNGTAITLLSDALSAARRRRLMRQPLSHARRTGARDWSGELE